jgi:hypothetical protein
VVYDSLLMLVQPRNHDTTTGSDESVRRAAHGFHPTIRGRQDSNRNPSRQR